MSRLKVKARQLKGELPVLYLSFKDSRTPYCAKVLLALTVGYALSPIDFIPDFIPVLGYLDDVLLLPFLCWLSIKLIPEAIVMENREKAKELWKEGKPKKWSYALPIILVYLILLFILWIKVLQPLFQ